MERWGTCKLCKGKGKVTVYTRDSILLRDIYTEEECGRCNSEGFDGQAEEAPWHIREDES